MVDTEAVSESTFTASSIPLTVPSENSGMADRGNGIRLFNSRLSLEQIFEEFEESDDEDAEDSGEQEEGTAVITSQLRHFVIQVESMAFEMITTIDVFLGIPVMPAACRSS